MIAPEKKDIGGVFTLLPMDDVVTGRGSIARLSEVLARYGVRRALLVTGRTLRNETDLVSRVEAAAEGRIGAVFHETAQHVPRNAVIRCAEAARAIDADAIVSFGGGSPNDTAKAVVLALAEDVRAPEDLDRYAVKFRYPDHVEIPAMRAASAVPLFAIPTTLSAGEFTHFAGITDEARKVKDLYIDKKMTAKAVFLDPELTTATPHWLWLSSGIRAVDHTVEALCSTTAHPFTDALALHALRILGIYLRACAADPGDLAARLQCQIAAWMSVCGLANVTLGLSHGIGHQLGARCDVPHGITSCVMMHEVVRFNRNHVGERPRWLAEALGVDAAGLDAAEAADVAADALEKLIRDLGLPSGLSEIGVSPDEFPALARDALQDLIVATNPRPVRSEEEVVALLQTAYDRARRNAPLAAGR